MFVSSSHFNAILLHSPFFSLPSLLTFYFKILPSSAPLLTSHRSHRHIHASRSPFWPFLSFFPLLAFCHLFRCVRTSVHCCIFVPFDSSFVLSILRFLHFLAIPSTSAIKSATHNRAILFHIVHTACMCSRAQVKASSAHAAFKSFARCCCRCFILFYMYPQTIS